MTGHGAGSTGTLSITGAGSRVDLINMLGVGRTTVQAGFGTPGGVTQGTLGLLAGGALHANEVRLGIGLSQGPQPQDLQSGSEHSFASAVVDGVGSLLQLTHNTVTGARALLAVASGASATASGFINVAASNQGDNGVGVFEVTGGGSVSGDGGLNDSQSLNTGGGNGTGGDGTVLVSGRTR